MPLAWKNCRLHGREAGWKAIPPAKQDDASVAMQGKIILACKALLGHRLAAAIHGKYTCRKKMEKDYQNYLAVLGKWGTDPISLHDGRV
jgi:hypothetical protein